MTSSRMAESRPGGRVEKIPSNDPRFDIPPLGFRDYWYPVLFSRSVGKKPVRLRILGDDIVVLRSKGRARTLQALCPHRGASLHLGRCLFDGTLTCGYHGFTFDTATGKCVAALTEGPDSHAPAHLSARAYPTAERHGLVWVYFGEGDPPPLEEDLPENLLESDIVLVGRWSVWNLPWRAAAENGIDTAHPFFLHRTHPYVRLDKVPAFGKVRPVRNGKWLQAVVENVGMRGEFPEIGRWPPRSDAWFRRPKAFSFQQEVRLPGINRITWFPSGLVHLRWSVPIDEQRTLTLQALVKRTRGLAATWFKLHYHLFEKWRYHVWFQVDDQIILDGLDPLVPEHLTQSDVVVARWRQMAAREARRPQASSETGAAE